MKSLPVVILLSLLLNACQYNSRVQTVLDSADQLVFTEPGSAVTILDCLDISSASTAQRARHALLLTKAHTKAHIDFTNDTLIYIASEYSQGRGDSLEVQSLYY
ncbi:MAG: hypothetical protein K2K92_10235, partial [Duncaniella sp.]|nr:hypothetical protein [Duncaniella sp.]